MIKHFDFRKEGFFLTWAKQFWPMSFLSSIHMLFFFLPRVSSPRHGSLFYQVFRYSFAASSHTSLLFLLSSITTSFFFFNRPNLSSLSRGTFLSLHSSATFVQHINSFAFDHDHYSKTLSFPIFFSVHLRCQLFNQRCNFCPFFHSCPSSLQLQHHRCITIVIIS